MAQSTSDCETNKVKQSRKEELDVLLVSLLVVSRDMCQDNLGPGLEFTCLWLHAYNLSILVFHPGNLVSECVRVMKDVKDLSSTLHLLLAVPFSTKPVSRPDLVPLLQVAD